MGYQYPCIPVLQDMHELCQLQVLSIRLWSNVIVGECAIMAALYGGSTMRRHRKKWYQDHDTVTMLLVIIFLTLCMVPFLIVIAS